MAAVGCDTGPTNTDHIPTPYELTIPPGLPPMEIPADNPMTVEGVALGRRLFFEPMLSGDNTMSCSTCHRPENGFSEPQQTSVGINGEVGTRNAMAIINLGWVRTGLFWDGRAATLEAQALGPVTNPIEMNSKWPEVESKLNAHADYPQLFKDAFGVDRIDSLTVAKAIAQFERTLISGNSKFDRWYNRHEIQLSEQEMRGFVMYNTEVADCFHCHGLGGFITDNQFQNNGLDETFADMGRYDVTGEEGDRGRFRTPTLRNIEMTAPYMHDGRFFTLEEVVDHYSDHVKISPTISPTMELVGFGGAQLTQQQKEDLVAFLRTFTDPEFLSNPDFSDPNQ
ncbi:MAG: c-type cytochrome [Flavobacteriales bacterium]|nr:c-type cytochrome [Flavobacteriales bacterium]